MNTGQAKWIWGMAIAAAFLTSVAFFNQWLSGQVDRQIHPDVQVSADQAPSEPQGVYSRHLPLIGSPDDPLAPAVKMHHPSKSFSPPKTSASKYEFPAGDILTQ